LSGHIPAPGDLNLDGLDISETQLAALFELDPDAWDREAALTEEYFAQFGDKVPEALRQQLWYLRERIAKAQDAE